MGIIEKIQSNFLEEAKNSPLLLSDLAHMETYIAESYHNRSIIELLQNADDAASIRFYISKNKGYIIVANDGRFFNENDIISICRSGSSTKKRDGKSIGYRGIGFKSVVNLAERVHIISGDLGLTFSRELTNELIDSDIPVPLIRIPHKYNPLMEHSDIISNLLDRNFKTIFIFENTNSNNLEEEIDSFDSSSLLFLRSIKQIVFETQLSKTISVKRVNNGFEEYITISDDDYKEEWLVLRNSRSEDKTTSVAFLLDNQKRIIPLSNERSVVHSFMPTKDNVGLPFKINGDFSTDPSRTKMVKRNFSSLDIKSKLGRTNQVRYEDILNFINRDINEIILIRNKIAHGQWYYTFNTNVDSPEVRVQQLIHSNNYFKSKERLEKAKLIIEMIIKISTSPRTFERDFDTVYAKIETLPQKYSRESYEKNVEIMVNKFKRAEEWKQRNR